MVTPLAYEDSDFDSDTQTLAEWARVHRPRVRRPSLVHRLRLFRLTVPRAARARRRAA